MAGKNWQVALLRGVNVGGNKRVPMADFKALLADLGCTEVCTLLNSGNAVYIPPRGRRGDFAPTIAAAIRERFGFEVPVVVLTKAQVEQAFREDPFTAIADDSARYLWTVLTNPALRTKLAPLARQRWAPEAFGMGEVVAYLWCAEGILESPLWSGVEKVVGKSCTSRNRATMEKILAAMGPV